MADDSRSKRILLVEDEALIAIDKQRRIEALGYKCEAVHSGERAVETVIGSAGVFDLVLMDIDLGRGIDGTEAAGRILDHTDLPIVFMSSHTDAETIRKTEGITSYGYVVKSSPDIALDVQIKMALKLFAAKQTADRERKNLEEVFDGSPLGMMVVNNTNEVVRVNDMAERIAGKSLSALSRPRCGDFLGCVNRYDEPRVCGETQACSDCTLFSNIKQALGGRTVTDVQEARFKVDGDESDTADGQDYRWFRYTVSPITLDANPAAVIAIEDTTIVRLRDQRLRQFARLLDSGNSLVIVTDPHRKTVWANTPFEQLCGYSLSELYGNNPGELLQGPAPDMQLKQRMTDAFDRGESFETEILNFSKDGVPYWIHMDVKPLLDDDGLLEGFIAIQRDITDEKRYRVNLEARDDLLWTILEDLDQPFTAIDSRGQTVFVNAAFARDVGYSLNQVLHMKAETIRELIHEDDLPVVDRTISDAISQHQKSVRYRYRAQKPSGEYHWREDTVRILYDTFGELDQLWSLSRTVSPEEVN